MEEMHQHETTIARDSDIQHEVGVSLYEIYL